jgi:ParB family chromosome partitioning protein
MKTESTKSEAKVEPSKSAGEATTMHVARGVSRRGELPPPVSSGTACAQEIDVAAEQIVPDAENRDIAEGEGFGELCDSIRVHGVLQRLHVRARADGLWDLIDGERRWRAARRLGLKTVPCTAYSTDVRPSEALEMGFALNVHREEHDCMALARRLRQLKNQFAATHEGLAERTGLPLHRVKLYLSLFNASDLLLEFFESERLALKLAVELMRYEKAAGEVAARRLLKKHRQHPLTSEQIIRLREGVGRTESTEGDGGSATGRRTQGLVGRIEAAFRRDPDAARAELEAALAGLGFRLQPVAATADEGAGGSAPRA